MTSNILVISPTPSAPQDGGNRKRIDWLLSQLADRGHQIHFLLYNVFDRDELVSDSALAEMQIKWATVSHLRARLSDQKLVVKARRTLLKSRVYRELATRGLRLPVQYGIDDWCGDDLLDEVRKQLASRTFDAVLVEYVYLSRALTVVPDGVAKIIDTHDVFSDRHRKLIRGGVKPGFFTTSSANERRGLNRADVLLAIQQEETNHFRREVDERVEVLTVAHLESARYLDRTYPRLETVGLLGSGNDINVASTQRFCDQVASLPALDKTRFRIAGSVCDRLKRVPRNVELLGNVESLHKFFEEIDLFVNPMVVGTGLKIKSVEALSYGVPFLSTDIGTEGIDVVQNYHRFATLSDLTLHLASLTERNLPLEDYRVESVRCHQRFAQSVESQIDRLDPLLRRQTTGVADVEKSDRLTSLA